MVSIQNPADLTAPSKEFTFDSAYDSKASTESIYNDICYPLVEVSADQFANFNEYLIRLTHRVQQSALLHFTLNYG